MLLHYEAHARSRSLRVLAVGLALVFGCEWEQPMLALAQSQEPPAGTVAPAELPPIQEAETIEVRSPYYKRWWFWTLVAAVGGGIAVAVAGGGGGGDSAPPPGGTVTITGAPPP